MKVILICSLCIVLGTLVLSSDKDSTTGDEDLWIHMVTVGCIKEFKEGKDDWNQYAVRGLNSSLKPMKLKKTPRNIPFF